MSTRPPPSSGRPRTALEARFQRAVPYDLRGVLAFFSVLVTAWGAYEAYVHFNDVHDAGETSKMKSADIVLGILSLVILGVALLALATVLFRKLFLSKLLGILGPVGAVTAVGATILGVIFHFTLKNDLISGCVTELLNDNLVSVSNNGTTTPLTQDRANELCNNTWSKGTWRDVVYVVITLLLGFMFACITFWYHKQQLDPSLVRQSFRAQPGPSAYQMNGMPQYQSGPPQGLNQNPGWVPPYPGPPPPGSQFAPTPAYGEKGGEFESTYEAQEEAWRQAQQNGPTQHLTGSGNGAGLSYAPPTGAPPAGGFSAPTGPPPGRREHGYDIPSNEEEDEAWARARTEGVTAHLTGNRLGESGPGK